MEARQEWVTRWYTRFQHSVNLMNQADPRLGGKSPIKYWNECFSRWNGYPESDPNRRRWQADVVKPITRQKCIAIIAHVLGYYITPEVVARKGNGMKVRIIANVISDMLEKANEKDDYARKYLSYIIDAVVYGIAYAQEEYAIDRREVKDVEGITDDNGRISFKKKTIIDFEGPRSRVLSPYQVYIGDVNTLEIQEQPYIFIREVVPKSTARAEFGFNVNWSKVKSGSAFFLQGDGGAEFYRPTVLHDIEEGYVEIIRAQCKIDDEIAVFVQGVPMTMEGHPIPYHHKKYNISVCRFEIIDNKCFWGKSLTERLRHEQVVIDRLYRAILDKTFLNLFPPILAKGGEMINQDFIVPGKITPVDAEVEYTVPQGIAGGIGNELGVLTMVERSMDGSSIDGSQMGQLAGGERSATQMNYAASGTEKMLGLFGSMMHSFVEDMSRLRVQLILQFWARKERLVTTGDGVTSLLGIFERDGVSFDGEDVGSRVTEFRPASQHPTPEQIFNEEKMLSRLAGKKVRKFYVDPKIIREYDVEVYVRASHGEKMTPLLERAMQMEFYNVFKNDPDVDQKALKQETILAWKKNPSKLMADTQ